MHPGTFDTRGSEAGSHLWGEMEEGRGCSAPHQPPAPQPLTVCRWFLQELSSLATPR